MSVELYFCGSLLRGFVSFGLSQEMVRIKMVRPDQFWILKVVRPDQNWSGVMMTLKSYNMGVYTNKVFLIHLHAHVSWHAVIAIKLTR